MKDEEKILMTLKDFGRLPTTRVSAIVGIKPENAKKILDSLAKRKIVNRESETNATYWTIKKQKGETSQDAENLDVETIDA